MALPQQGTETVLKSILRKNIRTSVNGLTPTGDGNKDAVDWL